MDGHAQASEPKTQRGYRRLALDPVTVEALTHHLARWRQERRAVGHTSPLVFCWPDGRPVHPQTITDRFFRLAREAKLPHIRLHDVRHSYATAALSAGVHPKIVSERLGHASVAFTLQTYSHLIVGMDEDAASAIANHILGGATLRGATSTPLAASPVTSDEDGTTDPDEAPIPT